MIIHSKNGKKTIKLDQSERRQLGNVIELMRDLAAFDQQAVEAMARLQQVRKRIGEDGVYDAPVKAEGQSV